MQTFSVPLRSVNRSGIVGVLIGVELLFIALSWVYWAGSPLTKLLAAVSVAACFVLIGFVAFRWYQLRSMAYVLGKHSLVVRAGWDNHIIPLSSIRSITQGLALAREVSVRRIPPLAGWWIGTGKHNDLGAMRFFATDPLSTQTILVTDYGCYGLSPANRAAFVDSMQQALAAKEFIKIEPSVQSAPWLQRFSLGGVSLVLLAGSALIGFVNVLLATVYYSSLPSQMLLHANTSGFVARTSSSVYLLALAGLSIALFVFNFGLGTYLQKRGEKFGGVLLLVGNVVAQVAFLGALYNLGLSG